MNILGIGTDIIEIERVEKALKRDGFKERVFSKKEILELKEKRVESYAGKFAAKEAVSKALGTGIREFNLIDIEILNNDLGKPIATLNIKDAQKYEVELSISHSRDYATAVAIIFEK